MLGIGFPDRHALTRITPIKCANRELRSPPARASSFIGATSPFTRALMKVGSPPFADLHHCGVHDLRPGKAPESKLDGSECNEGAQSFAEVLEVLGETPRYSCYRSFNLPRVVAALGPDQFEPGEAPAYLVEDQPGPVAVLDCGRLTHELHRPPFA
jgi:hypothetical protein